MNRIHSIAGAGLIALLGCTAHPAEPGTIHVAERAALEAAPTSSDPHAAHRATPAPADPHAGHTPEAKTAAIMPTGYSAVTIDPSRPGGLQITTAKIEEQEFVKQLRTIGVVTLDETRSAHVHPKVRGWIDGIAVNFIGRKVRAGEALCSLYSQEVFAAELEFLAILDRASTGPILTGEFAAEEVKAQQQLVGSARRRLALWDVPKAEIARLESTRTPRRTFALSAPRSGVVVAKQALDGMFVDPSVELYTLSDLSHLWVLADVYEGDVPYVHLGDHAHLSVEGLERARHAAVAFIPPTLDEATRTLKMRFELANEDGSLRPGAFVSVVMDLPLGKGLALPESAVIRTGTRAIVFAVLGDRAEPREVKLGPLVGDHYRVDAGLAAGDLVATGAQFLLDSESRLRASSSPAGGHVH